MRKRKNKVVCVSAGIILNKSRLSGQTLTYFVTEDKNNSTERVFSHEAEILRDNFLENDVSNAHEKVAKQKISCAKQQSNMCVLNCFVHFLAAL